MGVNGAAQLTTDERQRALIAHEKVMGDKLWVTSAFELQNICAEISLQPSIEEVDEALRRNGGRVDFAALLNFVRDMKVGFYTPEPRDADTVRAFMAVGGAHDKSGHVDAQVLRQACERFSLNVDIDGIFHQAEEGGESTLLFGEFQNLLSPSAGEEVSTADLADDCGGGRGGALRPTPPSTLRLGFDYQMLVQKEANDIEERAPAPRRRSVAAGTRPAPRRSISRDPRTPVSGPLPTGGDLPPIAPRQPAPPDDRHRLRAKGIAPALYGGCPEPVVQEEPDEAQVQANRRRRKRRPRQAKCSPAAILGEGTHVVGRRGLLVDDPPRLPRHYPQQNLAQNAEGALSARGTRLPPIHQPKAPGSPRRGGALSGTETSGTDDLLGPIERRIEEITRRRLRGTARYRDVKSRVNTSGSPRMTSTGSSAPNEGRA